MDFTLERMVGLAGPLEDGSRASEQFRENLLQEASEDDLRDLMKEALEGTETYHNRALQDIVNNIGERIGFEVDYGHYQGAQNRIGYDGLWHTNDLYSDETSIVVETKKTTAYTIDLDRQPGGYMDSVVKEKGISDSNVYGLIVVGNENLKNIVNAIRGSQYREQIRVVSCSRLFELLKIRNNPSIRPDQAAELLLPMETIDIGSLIQLITDVVRDDIPVTTESSVPATEGNTTTTDKDSNDGVRKVLSNAGLTFTNGNVDLSNEDNATQKFLTVIGELIDQDHIRKSDLPYDVGGQKRYLINNTPTHKEGQDMHEPRQVRADFWAEVHSNTASKEKYLERMISDLVDSDNSHGK